MSVKRREGKAVRGLKKKEELDALVIASRIMGRLHRALTAELENVVGAVEKEVEEAINKVADETKAALSIRRRRSASK